MSIEPQDVIDYWIGDVDSDPGSVPAKSKLWYGSSAKVDQEIRELFEQSLEQAERNELEPWKKTIEGQLALVILLDQFTRNLNRGTKDAWKNDPLALKIAEDATSGKRHYSLSNFGRVFLYHPFHHAESIEAQQKAVRLFGELQETSAQKWQKPLEKFTLFVNNHRQIVHRFGRFPHRNQMLNRTSTPSELEYLTKNTRKYGQ
mgnify:CR=1 FL=1